jgi:mitochondrial import inner membrane translocase subunit TIM44
LPRFQQPQPAEDVRDPPREESTSDAKPDSSEQSESTAGKEKDEKPGDEESSDSKKDSKKDEPPPPPHGDKSPWQVFTDTLRSEFKASKEWNESTKQLASSAHQFTESESVKRARAAYDATAGAATSKTAEALKTTGKALGQGAAWTWDTKVVQGIRGGVNATGRGIEKATRPVRETKTFQSIKEAVDDGSSSRYGGWVEKEERRKKKELSDLKEVQTGKRPPENMEEDPKYVLSVASPISIC